MHCSCGKVVGVAGVFHGFVEPGVSVSADTAEVADALPRRIAPSKGLLAVSESQPLPNSREVAEWSFHKWLVADCSHQTSPEATEQAKDSDELGRFYQQLQAPYWCPAMLRSGGSRIIRDQFGAIAEAISVLFTLQMRHMHTSAVS